MDINLEKGRTEFMLDLIGPGSKPVIASIMSLPVPHIQVISRFYGSVPVHVCTVYKHMGSKQNAGYSKLSEIRYRSDSALGATKEVGHMLRSSKLTCHTKLCLVRSLALSRLRNNVAYLHFWQKTVMSRFSITYSRVYRSAVLMRTAKNRFKLYLTLRFVLNIIFPLPLHISPVLGLSTCTGFVLLLPLNLRL